ncbi:MAG: rRNA maturation RNase YbeY [Ruminococcus sp.]|jgi:probable rRNA maturation factor|nr:rRNA maturation RNase YbeY [Ruminococcus sp.]
MKIVIRNRQHEYRLSREIRLIIREAIIKTAKFEGLSPNFEVNVNVVDDEHIHFLNISCRGVNRPTDVLSFPLGENGVFDKNPETGNIMLGDIVLSLQTAVRQAFEYCHTLQREAGFLTIHSMLHLLGYDHETGKADEAIMRAKEKAILQIMDLKR